LSPLIQLAAGRLQQAADLPQSELKFLTDEDARRPGAVIMAVQPKNFTAKAAKIAKSRQLSSGQRSCRTEIFWTTSPSFPASVL
jgi:hypothetical protein